MPTPADALVVNHRAKLPEVLGRMLSGLSSPATRRSYTSALTRFLLYVADTGAVVNGPTVSAYRDRLVFNGKRPNTVNLYLCAIRYLVRAAAEAHDCSPELERQVLRVRLLPIRGTRRGRWLELGEAQRLLDAPNPATLAGLRDRAVLAILLGCGLRRTEVATLEAGSLVQRDAHWVIADLVGKGGVVRTVPMPAWAKLAVDEWAQAAGIAAGYLFPRPGAPSLPISAQGVYYIVIRAAATAGLDTLEGVRPHDLRRTFGRLAVRGGGRIEQIQLALGHASLATTDVYLGEDLDLSNPPCDRTGLSLPSPPRPRP